MSEGISEGNVENNSTPSDEIGTVVGMSAQASSLSNFFKWNQYKTVNQYNLFFLGINIVMGSAIDIDFHSGYWVLLFNTLLTGIGYILLTSSLAEMTSALPFSGGIYGIVRAFIHPFAGFYVACFELLINVFYIALSVRSFALLPIQAGVLPAYYYLVYCFVIYVAILSVCLIGGKIFWLSNLLIGITCLVIILIYILGGIEYANFAKWKHTDRPFQFGQVMVYLPDPSLTYLGVQYLPLASNLVPEARKDVPFAMVATVAVVFPLIISVITIANSVGPGFKALSTEDHPLIFTFSKILNLSIPLSHFMGLPGLFSTCFSFMYCFGRQASTMAGSGLLPPSFLWTLPGFGTPYVPLIAVTIFSFILNILAHHFNKTVSFTYSYICCMSTYIVVIAFFLSYLRFIDNYSSLQRYYRSPFGKIGAILGIGIFTLCMISVIGFQGTSGYASVMVVAGLSAILVFIFRTVLKGSHEFSEEEKNELFKAYLITGKYLQIPNTLLLCLTCFLVANQNSKQRIRKKAFDLARNSTSSSNATKNISSTNKVLGSNLSPICGSSADDQREDSQHLQSVREQSISDCGQPNLISPETTVDKSISVFRSVRIHP
jgi:amino acid transporter